MDLIKVTPKTPGFRRAGVAWNGESIVPKDAFTKEQWAAIEAEPKLIVSEPSDAEIAAWEDANKSASKKDNRPDNSEDIKKEVAAAIKAIGGDKKPTVKALNEKLEGWSITGKELDAIWQDLNKG